MATWTWARSSNNGTPLIWSHSIGGAGSTGGSSLWSTANSVEAVTAWDPATNTSTPITGGTLDSDIRVRMTYNGQRNDGGGSSYRVGQFITSKSDFGYGWYEVGVRNRLDQYQPRTVVGMFTYLANANGVHREIDMEPSRWGGSTTNMSYQIHGPDGQEMRMGGGTNAGVSTDGVNYGGQRRWTIGSQTLTRHRFRWQAAPNGRSEVFWEVLNTDGSVVPNSQLKWIWDVQPVNGIRMLLEIWNYPSGADATGQFQDVIYTHFHHWPVGTQQPALPPAYGGGGGPTPQPGGGGVSDITGATSLTFTPTTAQTGKRIRLKQTATGPGGTTIGYSNWSDFVLPTTATLTEPFTGTNGTAWNPANFPWTGSTTGGVVDIQSNTGRQMLPIVGTPSYAAAEVGGGPFTNFELRATATMTLITDTSIAARLDTRYTITGGDTMYGFELRRGTNEFVCNRITPSGDTVVGAAVPITVTQGQSYRMRVQVVGNKIRGKVWNTTGSEPANWQIDAVDETPLPAGIIQLALVSTGATTANDQIRWDDLVVYKFS